MFNQYRSNLQLNLNVNLISIIYESNIFIQYFFVILKKRIRIRNILVHNAKLLPISTIIL